MIIGIDPDVDKSGVAIKISRGIFELKVLSFWDLFDYLNSVKDQVKEVRVEASWKIKHNWHAKQSGSAVYNAAIGKSAGANHQVGKMIVEMCKYLGIPVDEVHPLKKIWKGPDGKITHDELKKFVDLPTRTNQEQRDACLLIL